MLNAPNLAVLLDVLDLVCLVHNPNSTSLKAASRISPYLGAALLEVPPLAP